MSAQVEPFRVLYRGPRVQIVTWRDLFVQRWSDNGTAADLAEALGRQREFVAQHPPRATFLMSHVKVPKLVNPPADMRALIREQGVLLIEETGGSVVALDVDGFAASIVYAVNSASTLVLPRPKIPNAMLRGVPASLAYFLKHRPNKEPVDAAALTRRYDEIQRELDAPASSEPA